MSILKNAIDSIQLGIEDFDNGDPKRLVSAVRNFFAGVLLLFKHKLADLSKADDEALIKSRVVPVIRDGAIAWRGDGKNTVDVQQIKDRFKSLEIDVDWKRLKGIQDYRNNIEHYHASTSPEVVRQYITDCFLIVRDFIAVYLDSGPRDVLGQDTWERLINEQEVFDAEKRACAAELDELEWSVNAAHVWISGATCSECCSDLIRPVDPRKKHAEDNTFECKVCGQAWEYEELLKLAGSPHDTYRAIKEGVGPFTGVCPECGNEGYDEVEQECVFCGAEGPYECQRCGNTIMVDELSWDAGNYCAYCAHMMSKDD